MRVVASVMLVASLAACSVGSDAQDGPGIAATGSGPARSFAATGFSGVGLRGADDVDVRVGPAFSVRAEGRSEDLDRLRIWRSGDMLNIGRRRSTGWSHGEKVTVYVTLPRLASAAVAGSGTMKVDRITGADFSGSVAGSGDLNIAALGANESDLSIAGSGNAHVAGSVRHLTVSIAGSGGLDAAGLRAAVAEVSVAGSGDVRATVNGEAEVSVLGSGNIDLGASARCKTSKIGSGSVRCGG
jgi:hypothetical protein